MYTWDQLLSGAVVILAVGVSIGIFLHGFPTINIHKYYKNNRE